jgi:site-specific DNA-methyltransferase (adenine-specific)
MSRTQLTEVRQRLRQAEQQEREARKRGETSVANVAWEHVQRLKAVLMATSGKHTLDEIALECGCARSTAHIWLEKFTRVGLPALLLSSATGRPSRIADPTVQAELRAGLREGELYTADEVVAWLRLTYGIECPAQSLYYWMRKLDPASLPVDQTILGDAIEVMAPWLDQCVDAVISDFPAGLTNAPHDKSPPLERLWPLLHRLSRGVVITTASQPFASLCVASNLKNFRHDWVMRKNRGSNFACTVRQPMRDHEHVLVFCAKTNWTFNPQREQRRGSGMHMAGRMTTWMSRSTNYRESGDEFKPRTGIVTEDRVPSSVQDIQVETGLHPQQKSLNFFRYLVRTYSNPGDIILDPYCGSATTCRAAQLEGRHFVGIEIDPERFRVAQKRVAEPFLPDYSGRR